jgi:hypothetical protein
MHRLTFPRIVLLATATTVAAVLVYGPRPVISPGTAVKPSGGVPPSPRVVRRIENAARKNQVVAEVRDGRRTLVAAADEFRRINPDLAVTRVFPADSIAESYCRQVIHYVRLEDRDDLSGRQIAPILEVELTDRLARGLPLTAGE